MSNQIDPERRNWRRLSPWSVLHNIASTLRQLLNNFIVLVPLAYGLLQLESPVMILAAVFGIIALIILFAALRYFYFSYQMSDDRVLVREGVIFRRQLELAFVRIQNVTFEHPFYFRPMGLVTVKIDSAGSSGDEVHLSALSLERAQMIRRDILAHKADIADSDPLESSERVTTNQAADGSGELLLERGMTDLVLHGLTNNRAWIILGGVGAVYGQFAETINDYLTSRGLDLSRIFTSQSIWELILMVISACVLSVMLVAVLSVSGAIFSYYGFVLRGTDDSLSVRRGLFTKSEIHMQKSRIQNIFQRQDWLDRLLGRVNLIFEQISHTAGGRADAKLLVPTISVKQALELSRRVFAVPDFKTLNFTSVNRRYLFKGVAIFSCLYLGSWTWAAGIEAWWVCMLILPVWCLHLLLLFVAWKRKGVAIDGGMVIIRQGLIGTDYIVIPAFKLQMVRIRQSWLMKRPDLAHVDLSVASRVGRVPYLSGNVARNLAKYCLYEAESTNRSWM